MLLILTHVIDSLIILFGRCFIHFVAFYYEIELFWLRLLVMFRREVSGELEELEIYRGLSIGSLNNISGR